MTPAGIYVLFNIEYYSFSRQFDQKQLFIKEQIEVMLVACGLNP